MNDLVERVARAISKECRLMGDGIGPSAAQYAARAAIDAMSVMSSGPPVEIRRKDDEIDEIVIRRGDVHIEQMSADGWFMGVDGIDGSYWQFYFGAKNRKSHVEFRYVEHHHQAVADFTKPDAALGRGGEE